MDFLFDDELSVPQSKWKNGHDATKQTEKSDQTAPGENSSSLSGTKIQEKPTSSSVDNIRSRGQDLVEKINESRTCDQKMMESFQEQLMETVTEVCQQMKDNMYTVYEGNSNEMQLKLQELTEVLESCNKLTKELMEASQALASLKTGLANSATLEP